MADERREELKQKVAAGIARNNDLGRTTIVDRMGERAIEAKDRATAFAKEHPITTIAGALAVGVLVAGLVRRSRSETVADSMSKRASKLANIGAELAMAYAAQALAATEGAGKASAEKLGEMGETALKYGKSGTDTATEVARTAGKRIAKAIHGRFN